MTACAPGALRKLHAGCSQPPIQLSTSPLPATKSVMMKLLQTKNIAWSQANSGSSPNNMITQPPQHSCVHAGQAAAAALQIMIGQLPEASALARCTLVHLKPTKSTACLILWAIKTTKPVTHSARVARNRTNSSALPAPARQ
jgi:hypothetical protein